MGVRQILAVGTLDEFRLRYPWLDLIKASVKMKVSSQNSDLFFAALAGDISKVRRLLEEGADARAADDDGHGGTALMAAARSGHTEIVQLLLPFSDPLAVDRDGETALMLAACYGHIEIVGLLLPASDPLAKNKHGLTALMLAACYGHAESVELLLPVSDSRAKDGIQGMTALMLAASEGRTGIVRLLLPDSAICAHDGRSAAECARQHGHESIAELIDAYALSKSEELELAESITAHADEGATPHRSRSL